MKTRLLPFLFVLLAPVLTDAQSVALTGTVTDTPDNQTWNSGTITFTFFGPQGANYRWTGGTLNPNTPITAALSLSGTYSVSVPDNSQITPTDSSWNITVCPAVLPAVSGCFKTNRVITLAGTTLNLTPPSPRFIVPTTPQQVTSISAYADSEIVGGWVGFTYYNLVSAALRNCTASSLTGCTSFAAAGNPDPPVSQAYTLTATGAQSTVNLTSAPIDTHTLSWRPPQPAVVDPITYANGDLHAANALWVYQSGSFTVASNVAYSSAANSFSYRSDGPTAVGPEWAQAQLTVTTVSATQNGGPCVRMSTSAQTAYCIIAASNTLALQLWNAGAASTLKVLSAGAITGDIIRIEANGTTISGYRNGQFLGSVTDATIATGSIGLNEAGNATANGYSNFQGGGVICSVQLDSSPDNVNFTLAGAISSQSCTVPGQVQFTNVIAAYVRPNITTLTGGGTVGLVYSGRLAPTQPTASPNNVANGTWANAGEVIWTQITSQGVGGINVLMAGRIVQQNGVTVNISSNIPGCTTGAVSGGVGFAYVIPVSGWLQGVTGLVNTGAFPQGSFFINQYLLSNIPTGGTTTSCNAVTLTTGANIALLLNSVVTGSSFPASFVGTTSVPSSPWSIPGFTTTLTQANPAAGAEFTFTAPTAARTCVQSVSFTLAAGSTNVNPTIVFTINGSKEVYTATTAQTSATTQNYSFSPGAVAEAVTAGATIFHIVPFNNGQLACFNSGLSTGTISSVTTGLNATTQYSNISFLVQTQQDNN